MKKEIYGCFFKPFYNRANLYLQVTTINRMVKTSRKEVVINDMESD